MPHTRQPPSTISQILATSTPDPAWSKVLDEAPVPSGADWGNDCTTLKQLSEGMLPRVRESLDVSRPPGITERDLYIGIPSTDLQPRRGRNRVIVCYRSRTGNETSGLSPLIVLFHGGGHVIGSPESEVPLARRLVQEFNAVVLMPAYRLAPEYIFPTTFNDAFEVVKMLAKEIQAIRATETHDGSTTSSFITDILEPEMYRTIGGDFIIGGVSAGATISSSVNRLYRSWRISQQASQEISGSTTGDTLSQLPQITGLFLSSGSYVNPIAIPSAYKPFYLSYHQNADAPPLDRDLYDLFGRASQVDPASPIWSSLDQRGADANGKIRDKVGEDHAWMAGEASQTGTTASVNNENTLTHSDGVRVYFQASGADISRDQTLIYERVLREECKVETRLDLYTGFGHCFWNMSGPYKDLEMSSKRMEDSVDAVRWLLRRERADG